MKPGDKVTLKKGIVSQRIWYADYGLVPYEEFTQGMVAEVLVVNIPRVCGANCADIVKIGFGGRTEQKWGSDSYSKELSCHENMLQIVDNDVPVSLGLINFPHMTWEVCHGVFY